METLTAKQAKATIDAMKASDRAKAALWEQWQAGVPGARFSVYALAKRHRGAFAR
jgi:hypothetical protein